MPRFISTIKRQERYDDVSFIILASGIIPRMKNAGAKSLFRVDKNSVMLDVQYEAIRNAFAEAEIIVVTGHMTNAVVAFREATKRDDLKIIENQLYETCGNLEEVRLALNTVTNKKVCIINGDVLFNSQAIKHLKGHLSCILYDTKGTFGDDTVGFIANNSIVESIGHGLPMKWSQIIYLENNELELFRKIVNNRQKSRLMVSEAVGYVVNNGGAIKAVNVVEGFLIRGPYLK